MAVMPDKPNGVYQVGDTVHWVVEWKGESNAPAAHYILKSGGLKDVGQGDLTFSNNVAGWKPGLMRPARCWSK